ncbi:transposase [Bradyrhizobium sp. CCGUVB1N3]|uniref:IS66 family transposase n=1 Tax=Bradyrhizobium sp. CCGUVB1N3 TaxID=2949629 RepID=UPI00353238C2
MVVSKFARYLPLYRQVQILAGHGIQLDRRHSSARSSVPPGGSRASTSSSCG